MEENDEINRMETADPEAANAPEPENPAPAQKSGGLKTRAITSVAIVAVYIAVLALTIALDWRFVFDGFTVLVTAAVALEVARAFSNKYAPPMRVFIILNIVLGYAAFYLAHFLSPDGHGGITAYFSVLAVMLLACIGYNMFSKKNTIGNVLTTMLVLVYPATICVYMLGLNYLPEGFSNSAVLMMFLIPAFSDTGAYIIGSLLKGPKLAPKISPKKTISGACGGVLGGMLAGAVVLLISIYAGDSVGQLSSAMGWNITHYLIIGAVGSLFVLAGDLIASYIKRQCEVKDFGKLLPGHGGVLDRVDSMIICAVFLYAYYTILTLL